MNALTHITAIMDALPQPDPLGTARAAFAEKIADQMNMTTILRSWDRLDEASAIALMAELTHRWSWSWKHAGLYGAIEDMASEIAAEEGYQTPDGINPGEHLIDGRRDIVRAAVRKAALVDAVA